jgi:HEAT repeat protein
VAEGCVLCAERFMAAGEATAAVSLYDAVRAAPVPQQRRLEAIRGAILARGKAGIPLLLEELRSTNAAVVGIALRAARELPGRDVTERLAAELPKLEPARQPQLLLAIGDRTDAAALPAVLAVAETGSGTLRLVAIGILDQLGNVAALPVLLKAAADRDPALGQASMTALARLEGPTLDVALLERLGQASGRDRQVLVALAGRRRMQAALPAALASTRDTDAGVRLAAIETVGQLGAALEAEALVQLVRTSQGKDRSAAEKALMTLCSRVGAAAVPKVAPLMQDQDPTVRIVSIDVLSSMGGAEALAVVVGAVQDSDATVQDEAVRALSTWPGNWPDDTGVAEPLLALVKSAKKPAHQIQALRGYLEYLKEGKGLKQEDKLLKLVAIMPSINRPEERRLAIAVLGTVPTADSLKMLVGWTGDTAVADEVAQAILSVVASDQLTGVSREDRQAALNAVIAKTTNDSTRKKAQALLQANK